MDEPLLSRAPAEPSPFLQAYSKMEQAQRGMRYPDRQQQAVLGHIPSQRHRQAARCQAAQTLWLHKARVQPGILTENKSHTDS